MSTYDDNLTTDRDKVRFLIGDTDDDQQMLSDNEIAFILTQENNNLLLSASNACRAIAAKFARDVNYRFSTMWQDASDAYDHFMDLAEKHRIGSERNIGQPVFTYNENINGGNAVELFWYGMHDNTPTVPTDS
jgi:hypothetical protein